MEAAFAGRYSDAQAMALASGNPAAQKLVEWIYLRQDWHAAGYDRVMSFVLANPHWPRVEILRRRVERMRPAKWGRASFAEQKSKTVEGMVALARANLERNDRRGAQEWVALAWRNLGSDPTVERQVLKEFKSLLSDSDHKQRLWRFIFTGETNAAIRAATLLSAQYKQVAKVARDLRRGKNDGVIKSFQRLSPGIRAESAMQYALARYYRQTDQYEKAADILLRMSADRSNVRYSQHIWTEREVVARKLLDRSSSKHWHTCMRLVAAHGLERGPVAAEAEFLSGWIALRFLGESERALGHFKRLQSIVTTPTERARAAYWLGRTYEALGQSSAANHSYERAARIPTVYYGQLAREALGRDRTEIIIPELQPSKVIRNRIANDALVRAYRILAAVDRPAERRAFLESFADYFESEEEMAAVAGIVLNTKGAYEALQLAKIASSKGINIDNWSYPTKAMPIWKKMGPAVETSLVFGLVRQESEFNPQAGSRAGAQGLMQLMPETARLIARQYEIDYDQRMLTNDPGYNVALGAAHLGDLVKRFKGSYVLALVGYNAGPGRAMDWIRRFGDPRDARVDPVDWIESIPFAETRFYVQKVLQNTQVYRSRLRQSTLSGISTDLSRGRTAGIARGLRRLGQECVSHAMAEKRPAEMTTPNGECGL